MTEIDSIRKKKTLLENVALLNTESQKQLRKYTPVGPSQMMKAEGTTVAGDGRPPFSAAFIKTQLYFLVRSLHSRFKIIRRDNLVSWLWSTPGSFS